MKRGPAILFIFLAITVILAHSFIPHIHHEDHMCMVSSPCPLTGEADRTPDGSPRSPGSTCTPGHGDAGHMPCHNCQDTKEHHHNSHAKSTSCELSEILVYNPQSHKSSSAFTSDDNKIYHKTFYHAVPLTPETGITPLLNNLPFRQKPCLNAAVKTDAKHYGGSRAPPLS